MKGYKKGQLTLVNLMAVFLAGFIYITCLYPILENALQDRIDEMSSSITQIDTIPSSQGLGYSNGDVLTVVGSGGINGKVRVTNINTTSGAVYSLDLTDSRGTGYVTGAGQSTIGGTGAGCTVNIIRVNNPSWAGETIMVLELIPPVLGIAILITAFMFATPRQEGFLR